MYTLNYGHDVTCESSIPFRLRKKNAIFMLYVLINFRKKCVYELKGLHASSYTNTGQNSCKFWSSVDVQDFLPIMFRQKIYLKKNTIENELRWKYSKQEWHKKERDKSWKEGQDQI